MRTRSVLGDSRFTNELCWQHQGRVLTVLLVVIQVNVTKPARAYKHHGGSLSADLAWRLTCSKVSLHKLSPTTEGHVCMSGHKVHVSSQKGSGACMHVNLQEDWVHVCA